MVLVNCAFNIHGAASVSVITSNAEAAHREWVRIFVESDIARFLPVRKRLHYYSIKAFGKDLRPYSKPAALPSLN
jgi:hypothetical protein